ncbi:hypothetical protein [Thermobrachium celere]|uniref:FeS cluster biogenesis domain-containing protein n=1 Tax=Thermobrachium celere DSM 8682 TaxID=941824 RepID=R7RPF5_9CLOT|nr:hypothetical protein [Thermobrachium celere]GFR36200.1 hypothetical protein TCEA9_20120 [Thermobrachium celere]CDF57120.1 hypothetical protein TCEL_00014 [Thermobrachium celere DSM 8682]CDF59323.1 hypothetical protein TCEL_00789 [Thermobrachium celere DSM 8682]
MEVHVTKLAEEKILEAIKTYNEKNQLRIYVEAVACHGAKFGLAFDDIKEGDVTEKVGDIIYFADENVLKYSDGIKIDYVTEPKEGFIVTSLRPIKSSCSSCFGCK